MNRQDAEARLKERFNISYFFEEQWRAVEKLLQGKRVLMVQKTGFGKSLCYQFPATEFENMTIVFSPLLSLMRDQINKLDELGIPAAAINSEQDKEENDEIIENAKKGLYKLLYIAPERQESNQWIDSVKEMNVSMVVIDEAHCISTWGHDFRPAFRRIIDLVKLLPKSIPVIATTATATDQVAEDILKQIPGNVEFIRGDLMRENFTLSVVHVDCQDAKLSCLADIVNKQEGFGIVYTGTRADTDIFTRFLLHKGISCTSYHAGNEREIRKLKEKGMMENQWKCILSTNALGMGIDKSDINFIIHTQMPVSPIHYYQEIGRAGRDGRKVNIILLYNKEDSELPLHFIDNSRPKQEKYNKVIGCLKKEPFALFDLMRETGLTQTPLQVILNDLLDQNIIIKVSEKKKVTYEYLYDAPKINFDIFEAYRQNKLEQLSKMLEYIKGSKCRMTFLCEYLGDKEVEDCTKCDNCRDRKLVYPYNEERQEEVKSFYDEFHPIIELVSETESKKTLEERKSKLTDGVAFSYYGTSQIGHIIHQCKYEDGGDFPEVIIKGLCNTFSSYYKKQKFDIIMYVPPTESGNLVRNLAVKVGKVLGIKVSHELKKQRSTKPQKQLEVSILKKDNLKDAFFVENTEDVEGKSILLIDDICDSKATLREIGKMLSQCGAYKVSPLVIAKTVGGDQV